MNIGKVCKRDVVTIRAVDEMSTAAQLMREKHVGFLVVVEPTPSGALNPVGVLTDRDIVVAVLASGSDLRALTVSDIMTEQPVLAAESNSTTWAISEMRRSGVRRLPVVGSSGQLTGILSLDDVLETLAAELVDVAGSVRNERVIEKSLRP